MPVTAVRKDAAGLTLTLDAEFDAPPQRVWQLWPDPPQRVWQLWPDPRQLERWWGPPGYFATVTTHDLRSGGCVEYHLTGPAGDQTRSYWEVLAADAPHRLVFRDGFAHADGTPDPDLPVTEARVTIEDAGGGRTRMSVVSVFPDRAAMERVLAMGTAEGPTEAVGQIDAILAGDRVPRR